MTGETYRWTRDALDARGFGYGWRPAGRTCLPRTGFWLAHRHLRRSSFDTFDRVHS